MKSIFLLIILLLSSCSYRGGYEGIQTANKNKCSHMPLSQYDECMLNASKSYDQYEQERKEAIDKK
jgi:hypothetical protein